MRHYRLISILKLILAVLSSPISSTDCGGRSRHFGFAQRNLNQSLAIQFVNSHKLCDLNAYVTGINTAGDIVFLTASGTWYYPTPLNGSMPTKLDDANIAIPIPYLDDGSSATYLVLPDYISAGRVWIARGELEFFALRSASGAAMLQEPSASNLEDASTTVDWGFIELTYTKEGGLFANLSFVDFIGLSLGMILTRDTGEAE